MPKTIMLALMDAPYESETTTTMMRIADSALRKGHKVNVFAFEGAVTLTNAEQKGHPNPVKGSTADEADHPSSAKFAAGLFSIADGRLDWIN